MNALARRYAKYRAEGLPARAAIRAARVSLRFDKLEAQGLVKLGWEPEFDCYDDSYLDDNDLRPSDRERYRKELHDRINHEGVWIRCSYARPNEEEEWWLGDSIGMMLGTDDHTYDVDLMATAIEQVEKWFASEACELAERATYAGVSP